MASKVGTSLTDRPRPSAVQAIQGRGREEVGEEEDEEEEEEEEEEGAAATPPRSAVIPPLSALRISNVFRKNAGTLACPAVVAASGTMSPSPPTSCSARQRFRFLRTARELCLEMVLYSSSTARRWLEARVVDILC